MQIWKSQCSKRSDFFQRWIANLNRHNNQRLQVEHLGAQTSKAFGVLGAECVEIAGFGEQTPQRDLMVGYFYDVLVAVLVDQSVEKKMNKENHEYSDKLFQLWFYVIFMFIPSWGRFPFWRIWFNGTEITSFRLQLVAWHWLRLICWHLMCRLRFDCRCSMIDPDIDDSSSPAW